MLLGLIVLIAIIIVSDGVFYRKAKLPERLKWWVMLPGGGIVAYFKYRKRN